MLTIQNLSHTYSNGVQALKGISLDIPKGMFGLLGPNGAGKSTLMRTIATLQIPTEGKVVFDGLDVLRNPDELRQQLGYLPQDFGVYPRVSAYNMLEHMAVLKGINNKGERKSLVEALLHQTNLYKARKQALTTFSGGMRQRFGIAQALIGDPKLIIVDEPTAGLDPEERQRFQNLLSEIGENVVVILSTHIVEDVTNLCPRMAMIAQGEIIAQGQPADLITGYEGRIWRLAVDRSQVDQYSQAYAVISKRLMGGKTVLHVLADDNPGEGFVARAPDLEDVYFANLFQIRASNPEQLANAA